MKSVIVAAPLKVNDCVLEAMPKVTLLYLIGPLAIALLAD
jgi:hypothetical protein